MFWDIHDPGNTIIIQLDDDRFDELIANGAGSTAVVGRSVARD